jgi:hypothetical protein
MPMMVMSFWDTALKNRTVVLEKADMQKSFENG